MRSEDITGCILAGGQGSRMGGVDKGLQPFKGRPLVAHALERLAPQVGPMLIVANRNQEQYWQAGAPNGALVVEDPWPDYPGPLAGFVAGLQACATPYLLTVPCDSPLLPIDLAKRLGQVLERENATVAMASAMVAGEPAPVHQPVFCLMRGDVLPRLQAAVQAGERKIGRWAAQEKLVRVVFEDGAAFANVNTQEQLQRLQSN